MKIKENEFIKEYIYEHYKYGFKSNLFFEGGTLYLGDYKSHRSPIFIRNLVCFDCKNIKCEITCYLNNLSKFLIRSNAEIINYD